MGKKWEYLTVGFTYDEAEYNIKKKDISELSKLGAEGWELIWVVNLRNNILAFFKREK